MGKEVYANGMEIACQSGDGKVVSAFPDVCMSPPAPPAGPIPVPYPNSSFSKDMKEGSSTVKIGGKPVVLADQSYYQSSPLGDEASTKSFGANVINHGNAGKTYFAAHSMNVKIEGKFVCRHLDITTSNHSSQPAGTPVPNPNLAAMKIAKDEDATQKCQCCNGPIHSKTGTAMTFDEWYGLNETDSNGTFTPKAVGRRNLVEKMKNKKVHGCTCSGRILPEPPCNVFRKPITKAEKNAIKNAHGNKADKYRDAMGIPKTEEWKAAFPLWSQEEIQKQTQINHLTPKGAGGCPTGMGNLQGHAELCRLCKQFDKILGDWQSEISAI